MRLLIAFVVAMTLLTVTAPAEAGPLRLAGRGVKAVGGKVVRGAGRVLRALLPCR